MKKFILCVLIVLLSACSQSTNVTDDIQSVVDRVKSSDYSKEYNRSKKYYDYYVPRSASLYESKGAYSIFLNNNVKILMSVDVPKIINSKYYNDHTLNAVNLTYSTEDLVYQVKDIYDKSIFELEVYLYADHYLINLSMNNTNLTAMVKSNYVKDTLDTMFVIAANVKVDKDAVMDDFYAMGSIDYYKDPVDLFEVIVPSEGRLDALIESEFEEVEDAKE